MLLTVLHAHLGFDRLNKARFFALGAAIFVLLLSWTARADAPTWSAPSTCPSSARFAREVADRGLSQGSGLVFKVKRKSGGYQLQVQDGGVVTHTINAKACDALLDAALMILSLGRQDASEPKARTRPRRSRPKKQTKASAGLVGAGTSGTSSGPVGSGETQDEAASPEPEPQEAREREDEADLDQVEAPDPVEASPATLDPDEPDPTVEASDLRPKVRKPQRTRTRRKRTRRWPTGLDALIQAAAGPGLGALPGLHGQATLDLGLQWPRWQLFLGPRIRFGAKSPGSVPLDWRSNFRVIGGQVNACRVLGASRWRWPLCAGAAVGQLDAWRNSDAPGPTRVKILWWSLLVSGAAQFDVSARVYALARLELGFLPRRPRVEIENGPRLCCGPLVGGASLGVGLRLGRGQ